jgi:hypothetical protein
VLPVRGEPMIQTSLRSTASRSFSVGAVTWEPTLEAARVPSIPAVKREIDPTGLRTARGLRPAAALGCSAPAISLAACGGEDSASADIPEGCPRRWNAESASLRELARGDNARLTQIERAANGRVNANLFPDGTLARQ